MAESVRAISAGNSATTPFMPGRRGGQLRRGNPGNKGNRTPRGPLPAEIVAALHDVVNSEEYVTALKRVVTSPDHPHYATMAQYALNQVVGKPTETVNSNATVDNTINVILTRATGLQRVG